MQTFLPYVNFNDCARVLDRQRLGKQRVETMQIMRALLGVTKGWNNHPAVEMWRGYERALLKYQTAICNEWVNHRGYRDTCLGKTVHDIWKSDAYKKDPFDEASMPWWLGNESFHESHRAHLIRKDPEYYKPIFGDVLDVELIWPSHGKVSVR